jgi:hypothetical protein
VQWFCGLDERVDIDRVVAHARAMADFDGLCLQVDRVTRALDHQPVVLELGRDR